MRFPLYLASRYLVSKKSQNAINIISIISIFGVAVGTAALVVVLSVFNGFEDLLTKLNNSFDPDIKISSLSGKTFIPDKKFKSIIENSESVSCYSFTLEENALLQYSDKQIIATIKGVDDNYFKITGLDTMMVKGEMLLQKKGFPCAVAGAGLAFTLGVKCDYLNTLTINVPSRTKEIQGNFNDAGSDIVNKFKLYVSGIFAIQQEYDMKYLILSLDEVQKLLEFDENISAVELKLKPNANSEKVIDYFNENLGENFSVLDRNQQHEYAYKIMKSEKWAIFMIFIFILLIASFNIIASITMLIIDKKNDISILRSMGASDKTIRQIFFIEGLGISFIGAIIGIILGCIVCWLQIEFELIKLGNEGAFIIDAYPVVMNIGDIVFSFFSVLLIGFLAAWLPVKFITGRLKTNF